tara:strand:+ start:335 stop:439 length:105 start_codon:yes stop_codon:yes gene_type:complete
MLRKQDFLAKEKYLVNPVFDKPLWGGYESDYYAQ